MKISFGSKALCIWVEILQVTIISIQLPNKNVCNYLNSFSSFSVHKFCGQTDGHALPDEDMYMSIPILTISQISPPYDQS